MALETADILKQFGFDPEKITDAESFKKQFNTTFISREVAVDDKEIRDAIIGRKIGGIQTKTKRMFKDFGVEFENEDLKDIKLEDLIELGTEKLTTLLQEKETELKSTFESTKDETVIKLDKQIEVLNLRVGELDELNTLNVKKFTDAETDFTGKMKEFKMGSLLKDANSRLKIRNDASDLEKAGFNSVIKSKYSFDIDDKDGLLVMDKDGNRVKNESGNNFATIDEVLTMEAKSGNILQQNNSGGSNVKANAFAGNTNTNTNNNDNNSNGKAVQLHPNAV